ncbi:MAG: hypothetical protein ABL878_20395 [Burkholderiales bacterium]
MINPALPEIAMAAPVNLHHVMGHDHIPFEPQSPPPSQASIRSQRRIRISAPWKSLT